MYTRTHKRAHGFDKQFSRANTHFKNSKFIIVNISIRNEKCVCARE